MNDKSADMRIKLYRCLEISMKDDELGCHVSNIIRSLAHCIEDGDWYDTTIDVWCDYFLLMNEKKDSRDEIYPLTLVKDRYTGVYSGGKWTAWNLFPEDVPEGIFGDDCGCHEFWLDADEEYCVGKGDTPHEAAEDLKRKMALKN